MGAIKDIVDLAKDLEASVKDRRDMETIHKIQALAFSLQASDAEIAERDIRVMQENAKLVQENADLKRQLAESQAEDIRIHKGIEFRNGQRTGDRWMGFCPKCHMPVQDAWLSHNRGKIVLCSARCGWQIFMEEHLADIAKELEV